jgi:hemoglobin/transferrin/lactoferrin receptor protein
MLGGTHPGGGIGMIANPELQPEQSTGLELGFNLDRTGIFTGDDRLQGRVNFYRMDVKNYVTASYPGSFTNAFGDTGIAFVNLPGTAETRGFEVEIAYGIGAFDLALAYTRNMSDMPSQIPGLGAGQYLPDATVTLTVAGHFLEDRLTIGGQYNYVSGGLYAKLYDPATYSTDQSYDLVDLFASYRVSDNFTINARIENLFDKTYVPWLSLSENAPGRTAYIGGEIRF